MSRLGKLALLILCGGLAHADPLDKVTGTETWGAAPQSIGEEWTDWYQARVRWRRCARDLKLERVRSRVIAKLLERYPDGPRFEEVTQALEGAATAGAGESAAPSTEEPGGARPDTGRGQRPGSRRPRRTPQGDPPAWIKVPVERLDDTGQAIDDEGGRELNEVMKRKPRP